jgi:hypothetical protein
MSEFRISVWNMSLLVTYSYEDISKCAERLIDGNRFFQPIAGGS